MATLLRLTLLVLVIGLGAAGCSPRPAGVRRVVLVSIDTLRASHLGMYGHSRETSPNLDRFSQHGVLFEDASSTAPWTLPAHASMLTGFYPQQAGARHVSDPLRANIPTLAGSMRNAGYRTAASVNVLFLEPKFGLPRGFDRLEVVPESQEARGAASRTTNHAIEFLEEAGDEPAFVFLHYFDVHSDYRSLPAYERMFLPAGFRKGSRIDGSTKALLSFALGRIVFSEEEQESLRRLYDAGVRQIDTELGRLFAHLEARYGFEDTLVIVTSDHGEAFLEHGALSHGQNQYQEVIRVPLILRGGEVPAGVRVSSPVSLIDLAPTILSAAQVPPPPGLPGLDLQAMWANGETIELERSLFLQSAPSVSGDQVRGVRRGRHKLVVDYRDDRRELYDLETDPGEQSDISKTRPDLVLELEGEMDAFFGPRPEASSKPSPLDDQLRKQLRELGYAE